MPRKAANKVKLTDATVRNLEVTDGSYRVWDTEVAGFGVKVYPSGKKQLVLRYKGKGGKQREFRVGQFGIIGVVEARTKAKRLIGHSACALMFMGGIKRIPWPSCSPIRRTGVRPTPGRTTLLSALPTSTSPT